VAFSNFAARDWIWRSIVHAGGIIGHEALIAFELVPGDVTFVLIPEQQFPFGDGAVHTAANVLATFDNADLAPVLVEDNCSS
jgi:hypothetical protein